MKLGSLFSGVGGLDMAVHAAFGDVETAWVSDFDTGPNKILAHRYPDTPNLGDITTIDWATVEPVDIIAGGFPCQDVSLAGRRAGMTEGTRSNLWGAMRTAIETIRPRYVVAENVRGLLSAKATSDSDMEPGSGPLGDGRADNLRALGRVLGDLADLGYDAGWCGLRAADVGAPHGRFRVFIVAEDSLRGGSGGRASVASDSASERADTPAHRANARPDPSRTTGQDHPDEASPNALDAGRFIRPLRVEAEHDGASVSGVLDTSRARRNERTALGTSETQWGQYQPAIARWEHMLGRPAPAPTESNGQHRTRLSPRFVEWMMGLPDGWVTDVPGLTRAEALKALGNGVVPQQGAAAIRHLLDLMEGQDQ